MEAITDSSASKLALWSDHSIDLAIRSAESRLIELEAQEASEAQPGSIDAALDDEIRLLQRRISQLELEERRRDRRLQELASMP